MALREQNLSLGMVRDLLDVQANCSLAVGDPAQAADRYGLILKGYLDGSWFWLGHSVPSPPRARARSASISTVTGRSRPGQQSSSNYCARIRRSC